MTTRIARLLALACIAMPLALAASARADVPKCQAAVSKAAAAYAKAELRALARCEDGVRRGTITPQDCRMETKTAAILAKADAKRAATIGKACGGADKACGGDLTGEDTAAALGWPGSCPGLTGYACEDMVDPATCAGVDACVECMVNASVDSTIAVAYDDLAAPSGDKPLDKCRAAVAKAGPVLHAARQKSLGKCWKLVGKGVVTAPCPPHSLSHDATAAALAAAEAKARAAICKACGGDDKACGGGDDLTPAAIGFPANCPLATAPGAATSCAGAVGDLTDLADCVVCTADFASDCADAATVPQSMAYPELCNQVCEPGATQACYTGPAGTENVGECVGGIETCDPDGLGFGPCMGEVAPSADVCGNGFDEDCDGLADDEANDADGDGYAGCGGTDCCELGQSCGADPADVNPGAFEVLANGVDDDCDPGSDDLAAVNCSSTPNFDPTGMDLANAMELCETASDLDPPETRQWGVLQADVVRVDLSATDPLQRAVMTEFGTAILPLTGTTFAGLSNGRMRDLADPGAGGFDTQFGHDSVPPLSYTTPNGGSIPAEVGCNPQTDANDSAVLRLRIRVPANARSFSYDFRYFTTEAPIACPTNFQDPYLALLTSLASGLPADGNVSAQGNGVPFNTNNPFLAPCGAAGCLGTNLVATDELTPWMTTTAPVVPGEEITLDLVIFDTNDNRVDSETLLDNFRWSTAPVVGATTIVKP